MMKRIIEKTDDGSATLFVPELNEHYHSTKGARTESQHIFIDTGSPWKKQKEADGIYTIQDWNSIRWNGRR